jgi:hypothetical protein
MDVLALTMLVALQLGVPQDMAAAGVAAEHTMITGAVALVTFERREVRKMSAIPPIYRRRGRTMVFAVAATGDLQMALLGPSGRVVCSGSGFVDPASTMVYLQGCGV